MKSGIYKFTNIINNKVYIGSAVNLKTRRNGHLSDLRLNKHKNKRLQFAFNKYKEINFKWEIIEYCKIEDLLIREQYYLDTFLFAQEFIITKDKRFYALGYNCKPIAGASRGWKMTTKSRQRISDSKKGTISWMKGKKHSEKSKKIIKEKRKLQTNLRTKSILQYDLNMNFIKEFKGASEAERELNLNQANITSCCQGKRNHCGNFKWQYKNVQ